jgi:hypothetical protein
VPSFVDARQFQAPTITIAWATPRSVGAEGVGVISCLCLSDAASRGLVLYSRLGRAGRRISFARNCKQTDALRLMRLNLVTAA